MGFSAPRLNLMLLMTVEPEHDWKRRPVALAVFAYALLYLIPTQRRNFWIVRWLSKSPRRQHCQDDQAPAGRIETGASFNGPEDRLHDRAAC
jgi:hypothetical protein